MKAIIKSLIRSLTRSASRDLISGGGGGGGGSSITTDPNLTAISTLGWDATYTSPPGAFDPVGDPKYAVVSRQGFDNSGNATTRTDNFVITSRVRQAYPNQGTLSANRVALVNWVYSTDTITGVTNNSVEVSPVPIANWAVPDHAVVGNSFPKELLEVVAYHRNARLSEEIACVKWTITDGTNTVTVTASTSVISGRTGDVNPIIVYRPTADVDITSLTAGQITVNAKVYPWIGGAASVADSSLSSVRREFSPRIFLKNVTLAASPFYAYVNASTGNDTTGAVSTTAATAEASPCLTIEGAINRLIAVGPGNVDGCEIRLMAGTVTLGTTATTRAQTTGYLTVTRDPNTTRAAAIIQYGTVSARLRLGAAGGWLKFKGVTISRTNTLSIIGEAASLLEVWYDDIDYQNGGFSGALFGSNSNGYCTAVTFTSLGTSVLNAGATEVRMIRGCSSTSTTVSMEPWLVLGSTFTPSAMNYGTRTESGAIVAFNKFVKLTLTLLGVAGTVNTINYAFVQNVCEWISATSNPTIGVSNDAKTGNSTHVVIHHNTFAGFWNNGRANLFYDEGATPRTNKLHSCIGNIHVQMNTKGDVFVTDGTRVGNWSFLYGVGSHGEFTMFRDAGSGGLGSSFAQQYPGLYASYGTSDTVRNDPLYVSDQATTSGPTAGAGGGNYALQSGSPAKARLLGPVLRFDLAGATRSTTAASSGAYE